MAGITGAIAKIAGLFYDKGGVEYNVLHPDFAADPTGVLDSTAAFHAAIAEAGATKGGRVRVPDGIYAVNLVITTTNVKLLANSGIDTSNGNKFVPYDPTKPVITVGSAAPTAFFWGVQLRDIALMATGPNGVGQVGLKIMAGGQRCSYDNIAINGFTTHGLRIESGTDATFGSVSRQYFDRLHIQNTNAHNRALISIDYNFGGAGALQYVTAVYFKNLSLNGSNWGVTGRTATSGAVGALNDSGATWVVNAWAGMAVTIVSGTGIGQTRDIASNTATQLVPTVNFTTAPDATSRYEIVGYVYENDGAEVGFTDSYADVLSWRSFRHRKDGATKANLLANNLNIDGATPTDIVFQTENIGAFAFSVGNYIAGLCNIDGYILADNGVTFKPTGRQYSFNQSQITNPYISGSIFFSGTDTGDTTGTSQMGPTSGHASTFQIKPESTLNLFPGTGLVQLIAPAGTAALTLFETTGSHTSTLRMSGGTVQLFSEATKSIELRAGGATATTMLKIDTVSGPVLPTYTVATRPAGAAFGAIIAVSDGGAGAQCQMWNGAAWVNLG